MKTIQQLFEEHSEYYQGLVFGESAVPFKSFEAAMKEYAEQERKKAFEEAQEGVSTSAAFDNPDYYKWADKNPLT